MGKSLGHAFARADPASFMCTSSIKPNLTGIQDRQAGMNSLTSMMQPASERPDTPCVAVCSTTFDDICRGCGRTVAEVAEWVFMNPDEKEVVWQRILAEGYPRRNT
jgi:predicted Fe-S protein YdhL (DUF1289 family)